MTIASVQNRYNMFERHHDDVLEHCERHGIAFMPFYPLQAGSLSASGPLASAAGRAGATPAQVALAWLLRKSPVTILIPRTASIAHLEQNISVRNLSLSDADFTMLDEPGGQAARSPGPLLTSLVVPGLSPTPLQVEAVKKWLQRRRRRARYRPVSAFAATFESGSHDIFKAELLTEPDCSFPAARRPWCR